MVGEIVCSSRKHVVCYCIVVVVVHQAYIRLSTTHGHITDCKLESGVYAGVYGWWFNVDPSCLGRTIYARQFLGAKPPIQFRHRRAERITQTIYTDSEPPSRMPNLLMPSAKLRTANLPFLRLWCAAVGDRTPASRTPSGRSNHNTTRGRWAGVGIRQKHLVALLATWWKMSVARTIF